MRFREPPRIKGGVPGTGELCFPGEGKHLCLLYLRHAKSETKIKGVKAKCKLIHDDETKKNKGEGFETVRTNEVVPQHSPGR